MTLEDKQNVTYRRQRYRRRERELEITLDLVDNVPVVAKEKMGDAEGERSKEGV